MPRVVVAACDSYDHEKVYACVEQGVGLLGGVEALLGDARKVLVNPNLLKPAAVDSAVTTHPSVILAVLRLLEKEGVYEVKYGDSPGHDTCKKALEGIGLGGIQYGARLAPMTKESKFEFADGITAKEFYFAEEVIWADCVINVCKMKTHALMKLTGAVKNPFGLVCGARKPMMHVLYPDEGAFAGMLADIHRAVNIPLHIMDAVVAMEGNGPGAGDPVHMGLIIMSQDPVAVDTVFCRLVNADPVSVLTNVKGEAAGIGTYNEDKIELILADGGVRQVSFGELAAAYGRPDLKIERQKKTLARRALNILARAKGQGRPVIDESLCIRCGICVQHCPVEGHALNFADGRGSPPVYDYKKCIRCYCCQEMCPRRAISKK